MGILTSDVVRPAPLASPLEGWWRLLARLARRPPALVGGALATLIVGAALGAPILSPFAPEANDFGALLVAPLLAHICSVPTSWGGTCCRG